MIRLAVRCEPELAERVLAELVELVPGGVEEERGADYVEFAIYGPPGELPELPDIEVAAGEGLVEIETTEIPDDWADRWRDFHEPVRIGDRLVVQPSWAERGTAAEVEVVIDPGRAFGTGAHATTSICLELLLELAEAGPERPAVADLGTGSGVLAIAAAKLGFGPIRACDHESPAVEAARANAELNGVSDTVEAGRLNLRETDPAVTPLWLANLTAPLLETVATRLGAREDGARPSRLIVSGLLATERDRIVAAYAEIGYSPASERVRGDWAGILLEAA
ncbi:MAG TPA: 50S ribosomal protein L11 methyltransferase [Solirubrobacterales bacterium]|nr:50S ribosomal protein L11 methyltransferase [Solirubrobacterales bacterium]